MGCVMCVIGVCVIGLIIIRGPICHCATVEIDLITMGPEQQRAAPPHPPQLTPGPDLGPPTSRRCSRASCPLALRRTSSDAARRAGSDGRASLGLAADRSRRRAQRSGYGPQQLSDLFFQTSSGFIEHVDKLSATIT